MILLLIRVSNAPVNIIGIGPPPQKVLIWREVVSGVLHKITTDYIMNFRLVIYFGISLVLF